MARTGMHTTLTGIYSLTEGEQGFFVLGCVDRGVAYALPRVFMGDVLDKLYTTQVKGTAKMYWHVHLEEGSGEGDGTLVHWEGGSEGLHLEIWLRALT